jgi:hypothetical protein
MVMPIGSPLMTSGAVSTGSEGDEAQLDDGRHLPPDNSQDKSRRQRQPKADQSDGGEQTGLKPT